MEWSKLKNIIIVILLLVNGFLLVLVGGQEIQVRRYEHSALTGAAAVLEQGGITVETDVLKQAKSGLTAQSISRDIQAEADFARTLLGGDTAVTDQGGGLYVYTGAQGSMVFRSGGTVEAALTDYPVEPEQREAQVRQLLADLGLRCELLGSQGDAIVCRQLLEDAPLFSCRLTFQFSGERLLSVSGSLVLGSPVSESSAQSLSVPTAVIRFLDGIRASGDVCTAVTEMRPGYRSSQSFDAAIHLTPVWLVSTDVSEYYLDSITGRLARVE